MSAGEVPTVRPDPFASKNPALEGTGYPSSYEYTPSTASESVGRWLGQTQSAVKSRLSLAYRRSRYATESALDNLRQRAQRVREERPLPTLAVISGSAFALGVTLAILRSRRK